MDRSEFQKKAIKAFRSLGYAFREDRTSEDGVQGPSAGYQAAAVAAASLAFGLLGALATEFPQFTTGEVNEAAEKLERLGELVGIRFEGGALLVIFVDADGLTEDAIIGRSMLIQNELKNFKRFVMRVGLTKGGVIAESFFVFSDSEKAARFRRDLQEQCKHGEFFAKMYVLPWCVDLSANALWAYKGWPPPGYMSGLKAHEIERRLFSA